MSTEPPVVWDTETTRRYWDNRHASLDAWRSGGNVSFDKGTNAILYAVRLVRLAEAMGMVTSGAAPLRVLDAGCGRGYFARGMASFGHLVDGIDASPTAINHCRSHSIDGERYELSTLSEWRPSYLYDVVFSVDVLFHIMDDDDWQASVENLASLVRLGGRLLLADHAGDEDCVWGTYQKTRARARYLETVTPLGFCEEGFRPNGDPRDLVGLHAFRRVA